MPHAPSALRGVAVLPLVLVLSGAAWILAGPAAAEQPRSDDPAWQAYERGAGALADGDTEAARAVLRALLLEHAGHPAATAAAGLLAGLPRPAQPGAAGAPASAIPPAPPPPPPPSAPSEPPASPSAAAPAPTADDLPLHARPTTAGRSLLVLAQTLYGAAYGAEFCGLLDCEDFRAIGSAVGFGGLAGLAASLAYSSDGISYGEAAAIDAGTLFGAVHGTLIVFAADPELEDQRYLGIVMAGQAVGTVAGAKAWETLGRPDLDDMAFIGGAGLLSLYLSAPAWAGDESVSSVARGLTAIGILDGAVVTAWIVRHELPMSWGRAGIIASSTVAGAFGGLGVDALVEGDDPTPIVLVGLMAAGSYTGAIVSALASRPFDAGGPAAAGPRSSSVGPIDEAAPALSAITLIPVPGGGFGAAAWSF